MGVGDDLSRAVWLSGGGFKREMWRTVKIL